MNLIIGLQLLNKNTAGIAFVLWIIYGALMPQVFAKQLENNVKTLPRYDLSSAKLLQEMFSKRIPETYQKDITYLKKMLINEPTNTELLYKLASLFADIEQFDNALKILNYIISIDSQNRQAKTLQKKLLFIKQNEPHNEIGLSTNEDYISDLKKYWTYSTFHYFRLTDRGNFGGRINYANRYGENAFQYQLEAYPKLSQDIYILLLASYAHSNQILYPTRQYRIEPYYNFAQHAEISFGYNKLMYDQFHNQEIKNFTGTLGYYLGNYFLWFRPSYYLTTQTNFLEFCLRKYFTTKNTNYTFKINMGKLPDIGDLPPLDQIVVMRQKGFSIDGQYALTKKVFIKGGVNYARQLYIASDHRREIAGASIGLVWQY